MIEIEKLASLKWEQGVGEGVYVVVDIGKTLSKVTLWSAEGRMLDRQARSNEVIVQDGIRRLDVDGIGAWLRTALARYRDHRVQAIVPVGHGAGVVALDGDGPSFAPLDYEQTIPAEIMADYRALRDPFVRTGSPALPDGLNLGSQLFWLDRLYPDAMARATLVPWAQYWGWFLCGEAVSEVTSLGCHTDLWSPAEQDWSPLAKAQGWEGRFAPIVRAGEVIGTLRPALAAETGLPADVKVLAGLHDSNAALMAARGFAGITGEEATILSTGTWFIAMRLAASPVALDRLAEPRDTLVNVDPFGRAVPSARFMGGREIESVIEIDTRRVDIRPDQPRLLEAVPDVIESGAMLLPTLAPGFGPFPDGEGRWIERPEDWFARRAAACLYAALVADSSLDLIGSSGRLLVEGRFAEAEVFVRALASLRPGTEVCTVNAHNDVSFGALRLIDPQLRPPGELVPVRPLVSDCRAYRARWHAAMDATA